MKRIKIVPLILTIFLLISMSCSKEWLEPKPLSFYAPENVFVDEAGFESGLVVCKKELNNENHGDTPNNFIAGEFGFSDLAVCPYQLDFRKITPSTGADYFSAPVTGLFITAYGYIKDANTIISRIDDIKWTDQGARNRILSEALWFRAYWYYRLVNTYGDIPWVGNELKGPKLDYFSTTREAILTKLQKDLEFTVEWLPDTPAKGGDVTKGAANHLLAKVYLANGEFDKAITAASAVINGPYALMTQRFGIDADNVHHDLMWDLHRVENKNLPENTETIYATVDRANQAPATWWNNGAGVTGTYSLRLYTPMYWRVLDSKGTRAHNWNTPGSDTIGIGASKVRTTNYFHHTLWEDASYKWNTTPDMRRSFNNWIEMGDLVAPQILTNTVGSPNLGEPISKLYFTNLADTLVNWYSWPHYKLYVPTPNNLLPVGGEGDWYLFRLAETYLLRAEAYYWKGQAGPAADDINKVRARANAPLITAADVTIDYIFDERARELYAEEPRHSEMVRVSFIMANLNISGYSLATISDKNWYHDRVMRVNYFYKSPELQFYGNTATLLPSNMLWPIPQSVITANTMGTINQNKGYDGADIYVAPLTTIPDNE
jgi:starch-binding outer membrane protein, SusD/RagB family